MIKYKRKVSIIAGESPSPIRLSQYDSDVVIELEIYATEGILEIDPETAVSLKGTKPDGNGISVDGELTVNKDKRTSTVTYIATFEVIPQMTAVAGESKYKLSLTKDGKELNTGSFAIVIDRAEMDKDTLPSESVIKEIVDTMDRTDELLAAAKSIKAAKKDIENVRSIMDDIDGLKAEIGEIARGVEVLKDSVDDDIEQAKQNALKDIDDCAKIVETSAKFANDSIKDAKDAALKEITDSLTALEKIDAVEARLKQAEELIETTEESILSDLVKVGQDILDKINEQREVDTMTYSNIFEMAQEAVETVRGFKDALIEITDKQNNIIDRLDALEGGGKS